jgi:hypothetical protein
VLTAKTPEGSDNGVQLEDHDTVVVDAIKYPMISEFLHMVGKSEFVLCESRLSQKPCLNPGCGSVEKSVRAQNLLLVNVAGFNVRLN